eukprot:15468392-Heterocapsa_arctica.AAC.1
MGEAGGRPVPLRAGPGCCERFARQSRAPTGQSFGAEQRPAARGLGSRDGAQLQAARSARLRQYFL